MISNGIEKSQEVNIDRESIFEARRSRPAPHVVGKKVMMKTSLYGYPEKFIFVDGARGLVGTAFIC
jgi:hypothetical protein